MIPPDVSKSVLIDKLPGRLVTELRRYNATRIPAARFKLRVAIHAGDIRHNATSWVGQAVNLAARILEAGEAKKALAESDGLVAIVASNHFYSEVIEQDPGMAPETYRRIETSVKKFSGTIWLRLAGEERTSEPRPHHRPSPGSRTTTPCSVSSRQRKSTRCAIGWPTVTYRTWRPWWPAPSARRYRHRGPDRPGTFSNISPISTPARTVCRPPWRT